MPGWVEILIRSLSLLIALFFITKMLGKKQMSQLDIFQYITGIVIGSIVATHVTDLTTQFEYALIALSVWFFIPFGLEYIALKSKRVRDFTQGKGTVFIQNGRILEENLKKERYTTDDLLEELRNNNMYKAADVEFAVLEPTGKVNVLPKKENQPVTVKDIGLKPAPEKEPQTVVMDGHALLEPLSNASLNTNWLETELDKMDVSIENVFLGQVDSDGQLTVDLYDDKITVPSPSEKPLLLAAMKKSQADLELFALASENQETKNMYEKNSQKMQEAIDKVSPYLQY
ncbi:DUF421 domain-containing protein [Virgibacillus salinus]|uniref:Uncharacterized membrane protein YcaP, DUF421 family n=1 Tax=Virgibacillus salinus TaxID=553311 RepID=A0A1H1CNY8_9BACI|nr:DUF421 domain-containing protein [Virgibacillus salinus]SDQ65882.1 Uncharacterized membrane protein YcaP, DUF421 family [Virgibacillus salinus]